ncbi:hypothetical protein MIND_00629800 [Mycena indigotica]|uniref:Mucoidy inhibitor A n=1 Tax=Mycena indigotica TaxID=2126181 RepID=A0A8H6SQJ5_9AGAR|nr:uncharacterized protein MIND_00629800 [Mycena indigotica]KAF7303988.1 hypothetical protein MIND_00629800 [Mycena indigotica]
MSTEDQLSTPPPFDGATTLDLQASVASKIASVSLYSSRAEITRVFRLAVKTGLNQVNISGLPTVLEPESLRIEGQGSVVIQDVSITTAKQERQQRRDGSRSTSAAPTPELEALFAKLALAEQARQRVKTSMTAVLNYINTLNVKDIGASKLSEVVGEYDKTTEKLEARKTELESQIQVLDAEILHETEKVDLANKGKGVEAQLQKRVSLGVFAESEGEVEISLIYAVPRATWKAIYDLRVDMSAKEQAMTLVYKAEVQQDTGESWNDALLTLETTTPTFGVNIPELGPWHLQVHHPRPPYQPTPIVPASYAGIPVMFQRAPAPVIIQADRSREYSRSRSRSSSPLSRRRRRSRSRSPQAIRFPTAQVTSKGNVSATFRVPGTVTIPSDGELHSFTIVKLALEAELEWVCVPKVDTRAHITAKIVNNSEYMLLDGMANMYLDGSFVARSRIPSVSPQETFKCPLGVDASLRITYHPVLKKKSQSGFYTKSANHVFTQRISVHNTKRAIIPRLKIIDQIPTSRDSRIEVKLVNPALKVPEIQQTAPTNTASTDKRSSGSSSTLLGSVAGKSKAIAGISIPGSSNSNSVPTKLQRIEVTRGIVAQWDGADDPERVAAGETLGLDRKLNWICSVPPQEKINLQLDWEVVSPADVEVMGL